MAVAATGAKTRSKEARKFKLSYAVLLIIFCACMYCCYTAISQDKFNAFLKTADSDEIMPVGYIVGNGSLIKDVSNMPLSPPKYNRDCGIWVPDGSMYHEREKVKQFLTCKPDGFTNKSGMQYIYTRTIGGRKITVWP